VFWTVFRMELAYLRRQVTPYMYFAVLFFMAFGATASSQIQKELGFGAVLRNAPVVVAQVMLVLTVVGQVITTAIVGPAILRDVQIKAHELVFTTRVTRLGYLGGRLAGAVLVMVAIYTALPLGAMLGVAGPWVDPATLQSFHLATYARTFLLIVLPDVLFVSALFFAVGALTRNLFAIYTEGVALLAGFALARRVLEALDHRTVAAMIDPFGVSAFNLVTRYWTVSERNTMQVPLSGELLANRLLWFGISAAVIVVTFAVVRLEAEPRSLTWRGWRRRPASVPSGVSAPRREAAATPVLALRLPAVTLSFGFAARWRQLADQTRFFFITIVREPLFVAIAIIGAVLISLSEWFADIQHGTTLWPVTGEMLATIISVSYLFIVILTTIYAGELVWRERQLRVAGTTDALPVPTVITMAGKFAAYMGAIGVVGVLSVLTAMGVQVLKGYHHFEIGLYARGMLGIAGPTVLAVAALAFAVHAIVNEKFVGHLIMILYFAGTLVLDTLGFQRVIYHYGFAPGYVYSDMNHFGQYSDFLTGIGLYYTAGAGVLLLVAYLTWPRGADESGRARRAAALARWRSPVTRTVGGMAVLATLAAGGSVWYNTAVLNRFAGKTTIKRERVAYERDFRHFQSLAAPRIVGIHIRADLVPERRTMALSSVYRIVNKQQRPLDALYVSAPSVLFHSAILAGLSAEQWYHADSIVWSRPARQIFADSGRGVYLYRLAQPLMPGDTIDLAFGAHYAARGYPNGGPNNDIVSNGTFLNWTYFPGLSYDDGVELSDDDERKANHLPPKALAPSIHDEAARANSSASPDADWVTFDAIVSTAPDQIAIAPGSLTREWMENGRRVFAYTIEHPIVPHFVIQSARYEVRRDSSQGVAIEVYYHPGHDVDVGRMIEAAKRGLAYYGANFSPYQFHEFRIAEFPRYQEFAQSFPSTVAYSEGLGFITRVRDADDDLNWPLFVTAHELAHQWWGHQITPANQQGAPMLVESLAEYSALMILQHKYGASQVQKFLRFELDRYLDGRAKEQKGEQPLYLTVGQQYIHYSKGSLAFYALQDYIGEDSLNLALHRFLHDHAFQGPPYTNTLVFLPYIRAVTPDSLQYVIHDLFETITLYDNKATAATATRSADGSYSVHVTFDARKYRADSLGTQTEIPIADYIDVGVFGGPEKGNPLGKVLAVRKVHVTQTTMSADFVVRERPVKAGIDPFNKLIDRTPEDNVRAVEVGP
jgi:ABC-2 type transport system permease protein